MYRLKQATVVSTPYNTLHKLPSNHDISEARTTNKFNMLDQNGTERNNRKQTTLNDISDSHIQCKTRTFNFNESLLLQVKNGDSR